jgi:transcriptional repressor NrdR
MYGPLSIGWRPKLGVRISIPASGLPFHRADILKGARGCPPGASWGYIRDVRCPQCSSIDDRVVDSRAAEDGAAIRRRRECLSCGRRFTTYERLELEEVPFVVVKRSGQREPFDRSKVMAGVVAAAKNRPVTAADAAGLAADVEERLRLLGNEVSSQQVGLAVLDCLRPLDEVTYLRFASVYKGFSGALDFQREAGLLTKDTAPKSPRPNRV